MATKIVRTLVDDLDGSEAQETVSFALDGQPYELDLNHKNAAGLRKAFSDYVAVARKVGKRSPARVGTNRPVDEATPRRSKDELRAIRDWAKAEGKKVSDFGRIPVPIMEEYDNRRSPVVAPPRAVAVPAASTRPTSPRVAVAADTKDRSSVAAERTRPARKAGSRTVGKPAGVKPVPRRATQTATSAKKSAVPAFSAGE